jgi:hypothetical protein
MRRVSWYVPFTTKIDCPDEALSIASCILLKNPAPSLLGSTVKSYSCALAETVNLAISDKRMKQDAKSKSGLFLGNAFTFLLAVEFDCD